MKGPIQLNFNTGHNGSKQEESKESREKYIITGGQSEGSYNGRDTEDSDSREVGDGSKGNLYPLNFRLLRSLCFV